MTNLSSTAAPAGRAELVGIAHMVAAIAVFSVNDAMIKFMAQGYPLLEVAFFRAVFAFVPLAIALAWRSQRISLATRRPLVHLARSAAGVVALFSFFYTIKYLPLAESYVLFFTGPLWITALSVPLLGERVGWRRWLAVLAGFAGVLVMLQPGSGVWSLPALVGLLAAFAYALGAIVIRRYADTESSAAFTFYFTLVAAAATGAGSLAGDWVMPARADLVLLVMIGLVGGTGMLMITEAFRLAPGSVVAPFEYTGMLWAVALGWAVFGDLPTPPVLFGCTIVTAAGLYILHREARVSRRLP